VSHGRADPVELVRRGLPRRASDAMAKWLEPLPAQLFVTWAPESPHVGPGFMRMLASDAVALVEHLTESTDEVGGLMFTQPNTRGGLHGHQLLFGPERLRNFNRGEAAQLLELHASQYRAQELDYDQGAGAWAVDLQGVKHGGVAAYCTRYASRDAAGDHHEVGLRLDQLFERYVT